MNRDLTAMERLRIERAVWTLDFLLLNMPRRAGAARRRETRANLYAAAADVGSSEALRKLGSLRRLAAGYLAAEYGERGPRPAYWTGTACAVLLLPLMWVLEDLGKNSFLDGIRSLPHATGVFHYAGLKFLGLDFTYTFVNGQIMDTGWSQAVTVMEIAYMAAAFVIGARTWRLLPQWRRWRQQRYGTGDR